jgi:hypothetical protein
MSEDLDPMCSKQAMYYVLVLVVVVPVAFLYLYLVSLINADWLQ